MKLLRQLLVLIPLLLVAPALFAQALDSSGNGTLKGAYVFRQVEISQVDSNGDVSETTAVNGTITFDGAGNYTLTGTSVDNTVSAGAPQTLKATGTYVIGAGGFGYISDPLEPTDSTNVILGAVAQGIFAGSSTEGTVNNVFIAIPAAAAPANATFKGPYWAGVLDFSGASPSGLKNGLFELTPNGQGAFSNFTVNGQGANLGTSSASQTVSGATYTFPGDGSISLNIPAAAGTRATTAIFSGTKTMYQSADGNFVLAWTPSGYDIVFGVLALSSTFTNSAYQGSYYIAGLEDSPQSGFSCGDLDSFYGSLNADGAANQIVHERFASPFCAAFDLETDDQTQIGANGTGTDFNGYQYAFGDAGKAFVAIGTGGFYSLLVGVHGNTYTGSGVFLNPLGVSNAASLAPITMSVAPGELVVLYGSGLSPVSMGVQGGQVFPPTLGGVQVLVNGTPAPIYFVTSTLISAIMPYNLSSSTSSIATIQVNNNGKMSQPLTLFISDTAPGIFSQTQNGLGYAAAVHASTGQIVTKANPAKVGETLALFMTGLGTVTPGVSDGALGPSGTLSNADVNTNGNLAVYFDDYTNQVFPQAKIAFAGLAPGLAGLYQLNVQVPSNVGPGDVYIEISTDSSDVNQISVPVGSSSTAAAEARHAGPGMRRLRANHGNASHAKKLGRVVQPPER
jgi:uncharacterized protein (TIGR03437 family)